MITMKLVIGFDLLTFRLFKLIIMAIVTFVSLLFITVIYVNFIFIVWIDPQSVVIITYVIFTKAPI
jgi:hypothetical protein